MDILEGLNAEQLQAVSHTKGPLMIIAGAGTGKTTVVTRRIAQLIATQQAQADEILALTFTEKAAGEMEERVDTLVTGSYLDLWISTFHAFGERILRDHALDIGIASDFTLLSTTEQWLLLRESINELELDYYKPRGNPTKFVQALVSHFSRLKDEDITPQEYMEYAQGLQLDTDTGGDSGPVIKESSMSDEEKAARDEAMRVMEVARAYAHYQELLYKQNALDFGDLIVKVIELFKKRPAILDMYRKQFTYILVDEFQDTNYAQYQLVKMLAAPRNNLTVVADDDQSIYHFRGASMSNMLLFQEDYPEATRVSLVENYRSRQEILDAAYNFIQHNNPNRLEVSAQIDKKLRSNNPGTGIVEHLHSESLQGEAMLVRDKILELKESDSELQWGDFAILVRANNQAENFLPYLDRAGIPYQFLASQGLFAKPVVLDAIAFLKLLDNYHESKATYRVLSCDIWNLPHEDIVTALQYGKQHTQSLYETCTEIRTVPGLQDDTYTTVERIVDLVRKLTAEAKQRTAGEVLLQFFEQSGYLQYITSKEDDLATEQVLYLNQLFNYVEAFERANMEKTVRNFVEELSSMIDAGEQGKLAPDFDGGPDAVKIMTVHASKGLEFEHVFIVNLVDKRFPTTKRRETIEVPEAIVRDTVPEGDWHLEEERRLFYVALTRARQGVYLASGEDYGGTRKKKVSRFVVESGFDTTPPTPSGEVLFSGDSVTAKDVKKPERTETPPSVFSFTQLKSYETCPWQYRLSFVLRVPVPGKASFSFGKAVHATLYEFFRRMKEREQLSQPDLFGEAGSTPQEELELQDLLKIYDEKWIPEWFDTKEQREEYYNKGKESLKAFYELHHESWPNVTQLEKGFKLQVGEYAIKGAIDRVDTLEDGTARVVDYKTGSYSKNGKRDMQQLYIYAMALQEVFEMQPSQLQYYYIEDNKDITAEFDGDKLLDVREWMLEVIEKILEGDYTPTPGFQCNYCDFRDICEYRA